MGIPWKDVYSEVESVLQELCLGDERNTKTKFLSEGTKKRLQFALALIGAPRVMILVRNN